MTWQQCHKLPPFNVILVVHYCVTICIRLRRCETYRLRDLCSDRDAPRGQSTLYDLFWTVRKARPRVCVEKGVLMNLQRTKYKRTTPKSHTEYSSMSISMGDGFKLLVQTVVKIIEKYFGLLYVSIYQVGTYRRIWGILRN